MSISVGFVVSVKGTDIIIQMHEDCNKVTYRVNGELYHGVAIRECVSIKTGIYNIVCRVEGEYLDEKRSYIDKQDETKYVRNILAKPIGYIEKETFNEGAKYLPMIRDNAYLMANDELMKVYRSNAQYGYVIGKTLHDDIPYEIDFTKVFNKHIGVFGNTGSGKSNTLTKLYQELFTEYESKIEQYSKFVLFDFNGEYTGEQITKNKKIVRLNTRTPIDRIAVGDDCFWDAEILCVLFKATPNTQKPFLKRLVKGRENYKSNDNSLLHYYNATVDSFLSSENQKQEVQELLLGILDTLEDPITSEELRKVKENIENLRWHTTHTYFYYNSDKKHTKELGANKRKYKLNNGYFDNLSFIDQLLVRANLQMIKDLLKNYIQFEHISPLLSRIKATKSSLINVLEVDDAADICNCQILLTVISFCECNQDIKKILPLMLAKSYYEKHKVHRIDGKITKTLHLIVDEAHNILSSSSSREEASWKDYRLDLFEEIIKEGRKFGVFMTIASQRPADISPTIMSQFHNYFIHRLVNDRDLELVDNAISSLDRVSKSSIPQLPVGACIITGTSFLTPLTVQVDKIMDKKMRPFSDDVELDVLWELKESKSVKG